ncbi:MFS transporter [Aestuariivita sp.]|jgi:EmrB/QacA subfamily drug resistance transporter|uniref:MFS transporter n=1 Tax=Aestuariivita sp. TaxID=1872407 RepID=UPI002173B49B|nr:MFS transporter [Aestuariivita sp.]MCE8006578.1 MFS transporter [Aestuariivita sp.]
MSDTGQASSAGSAAPVSVPGFCAPQGRKFVLFAAILASALGFIDGTVVAIAMPAIRETLGATLAQAQWVHNAYLLTLSALILVGGAAGDRFGLARVFTWGIGAFVVASMLCAVAPNAEFLIVMRALQGIGAAIMVPGSMAIIARAYPKAERGRAIGIWAAASALTTALGPIIGGLALSLGGPEMWRWIFAVNLPLGALAIYLLRTRVQADPNQPGSPIDYPGALSATIALLALAWGLTSLQHGQGASVTLWIGAGLGLLVVFLIVEARSDHAMMPLTLFASRNFTVVNLLCFVLYGALNIVLFFLPMTMIAGWGIDAFQTSAAFAPLSVFIALLSARIGQLAVTWGPAPLLSGGSALAGLGYAAMALVAPYQMFWDGIVPAMCLVGLGMAMVVAPLSTTVMAAVADNQAGIASGVNNAITRLAGLIWVAAVGGLVAGVYAAAGGTDSFGVTSQTPGHAGAMTAGFQALAWFAAALCALSAGLALLTRRNPVAPPDA